MNVLVVCWKWNNTGGDWSYTKNLVKLYLNKGYNVFALSTNNEFLNIGQKQNFISGSLLLENNNHIINKLTYIPRFIRQNEVPTKIINTINSMNWSHVHVQSSFSSLGYNFLLKLNRNIKILYTLHDFHFSCATINHYNNDKPCRKCITDGKHSVVKNNCRNNILQSFGSYIANLDFRVKQIVKRVDHFLCPSIFMKNTMIAYGISTEKLLVSGYCFDFEKDDLANIKLDEDIQILYVGRIEKYKGVLTLVKAVEETNYKLNIIGDGSYRNDIEKYVNQKNLKNKICIMGKLDPNKVRFYQNIAKVIVVPSEWYENYPFAVSEVLALGKPVIGSNIGGIPELIINNKNGYLFEPGNHDDLKLKIDKLINEGVSWNSTRIKNNILKKFNHENHWLTISELIN